VVFVPTPSANLKVFKHPLHTGVNDETLADERTRQRPV
jgi:hypothetical protein